MLRLPLMQSALDELPVSQNTPPKGQAALHFWCWPLHEKEAEK